MLRGARLVGEVTSMNDGIARLWEGLRDAGLPEVMLYLPDGGASRCHWDDTVVIGASRVALLGDQDRNIVRIMPLENCVGIGIPAPKGTDPVGYRAQVRARLTAFAGAEVIEV
jgi:hypothetical protein